MGVGRGVMIDIGIEYIGCGFASLATCSRADLKTCEYRGCGEYSSICMIRCSYDKKMRVMRSVG